MAQHGKGRFEGSSDVELNAAELELLKLLGEGQTIKSAAVATGASVGSVSERLRSARRKTGSGSSRELARRLQNTNSVATGSGVVKRGTDQTQNPSRETLRSARSPWRERIIVMLGLSGAAIVGAVLVWQAGVVPLPQLSAAGEASRFPFESASPLQLHKLVATEPRDPSWSEEAETRLQAAYRATPGAAADPPMVVRCGTTLCEVRGDMPERAGMDAVNVWMSAVQGPAFHDKLEEMGFTPSGQAFFGIGKPGARPQYAAYWLRR